MDAEERIFSDPLYQDAQPQFVRWIEQLQRAKTANDLNDLHEAVDAGKSARSGTKTST